MVKRAGPLLDVVLTALIAISLAGGIPYGGRVLLRHAADPRRAAILVALGAAWAWPKLREQSYWLRGARRLARALERPTARWALLAGMTALSVLVSVLQALALRYPLWDVGIFHQVVWSTSRGFGFHSSISGAGDFLRDHLSPSLALLSPAMWLSGGSALTLPIAYPLLIGAGLAAWIWLAGASPTVAAATTIVAISLDSLWANRAWGFHESAISFAALSWAIALGARGRRPWLALALLLVGAGAKEMLLLQAAALALIVAVAPRQARVPTPRPLARAGLGALALGLVGLFLWFESIPHPEGKNYFGRYYAYLGLNTADFAGTLLRSPGLVLEHVGLGETARYFKTVFLPWLFIPLLLGPRWPLIAIAPAFAASLLATYPPLRSASFHYVLELWPVLASVTIIALAGLAPHRRARRLTWAWALLALLAFDRDPVGDLREYGRESRERAGARAQLVALPAGQSVAASELAGPWVASRSQVTRLPMLPQDRCPDWIVVQGLETPPPRCPGELKWAEGDWRGYRR